MNELVTRWYTAEVKPLVDLGGAGSGGIKTRLNRKEATILATTVFNVMQTFAAALLAQPSSTPSLSLFGLFSLPDGQGLAQSLQAGEGCPRG